MRNGVLLVARLLLDDDVDEEDEEEQRLGCLVQRRPACRTLKEGLSM